MSIKVQSLKLHNSNDSNKLPLKKHSFGICSNGKNKVYIFGGAGDNVPHNNEFHMINVDTCETHKLPNNKIEKRSYCTLNYLKNNIYLFGGFSSEIEPLSDIWKYNIELKKWKQLKNNNKGLACHTSHIYNNNLIIFGGSDNNNYCNDILIYNIDKNIWNIMTINSKSKKSTKRGLHASTIVNDKLFIYGGQNGPIMNDC